MGKIEKKANDFERNWWQIIVSLSSHFLHLFYSILFLLTYCRLIIIIIIIQSLLLLLLLLFLLSQSECHRNILDEKMKEKRLNGRWLGGSSANVKERCKLIPRRKKEGAYTVPNKQSRWNKPFPNDVRSRAVRQCSAESSLSSHEPPLNTYQSPL